MCVENTIILVHICTTSTAQPWPLHAHIACMLLLPMTVCLASGKCTYDGKITIYVVHFFGRGPSRSLTTLLLRPNLPKCISLDEAPPDP